jgi:hypothetical protein
MTINELYWEALLCCIEENQIEDTVQPVADSLGLDDSDVSIESYTAFESSRRRQPVDLLEKRRSVFKAKDGAWDIQYLIKVAGIDETLYTETLLKDAAFVDSIGENIGTSINIVLELISTQNVSIGIISSSPTSVSSQNPTPTPTLGDPKATFFTTGARYISVVVVSIGICLISICVWRYDCLGIRRKDSVKKEHAEEDDNHLELVIQTNL